MYDEPKVIYAGCATDDRGSLIFCNDFNLSGVVRFYAIANHRQFFVRAWHGHVRYDTYLWPIKGVWKVAATMIDDRLPGLQLTKYVLDRSAIWHIPAGWYHGHQNLTEAAILGVFSTATIEQIHDDDHRQPWDWLGTEIWEEAQR